MDTQVLFQFGVSTVLALTCVLVHGVGLFSLNKALRSEASLERMRHLDPLSPRGVLFTFVIVLSLVGLHSIEIWLYAITYMGLGAHDTLEEAIYVSTISYSTVGFSDHLIDQGWRLIAAFESILGVILLGWSTAFFFRLLGRIDDR